MVPGNQKLPTTFWLLVFATVFIRMGFFVESFLTIYLKAEAGFDESLAALMMVLYGLGGATTALLSGPFIDRFGPARPLLLSLVLTAGAAVVLAFGPPTWILWGIVLMMGAVGQVIMPATNAQITVLVPGAQQRRAFSLVYIALNSGLAFGPLIGGMLAEVSFKTMFATGASLIVVGAVVLKLSIRSSASVMTGENVAPVRGIEGLRTVLKDQAFIRFNMLNWLFMGLYLQVFVILPLFMLRDGMSARDYGIVMAVNGLILVVVQLPTDRVVRRFNPARLLTVSAILLAAGLVMNSISSTIWMYLFAAVFWTAAELVNIPLAASVTAALSSPGLRGSYLAVHGVAFPAGVAIASLFGSGAFYFMENPKLIWLILAGASLVLMALRYRNEPRLRVRLQTTDTPDVRTFNSGPR